MTDSTVEPYSHAVETLLRSSPVLSLLRSRPAVVLERIAFGAGTTRWYFITSPDQLDNLATHLSPGSLVSFYFDNRLHVLPLFDERARASAAESIDKDGDVVVGTLQDDKLRFSVEVIDAESGLEEWARNTRAAGTFLLGSFPGIESGNQDCVTIAVPDHDGVVRAPPH